MAAFVVRSPSAPSQVSHRGTRLNIFPGAVTPSVFGADTPFWIGYAFAPEGREQGTAPPPEIHPQTRFELFVDGEPAAIVTETTAEGERVVGKVCAAEFGSGLPVGWHRFAGRWYDAGELVLTSDRSIEFVEP